MLKLWKRNNFFWTFLTEKSHFFKNSPSKLVLFFCVLPSVHQDASFEPSQSTIRWFSIFTLVRDPSDLGGVKALPQGDGLFTYGFQSVFLGPYGISHTYKCQGKNNCKVWFLDTTIVRDVSCPGPWLVLFSAEMMIGGLTESEVKLIIIILAVAGVILLICLACYFCHRRHTQGNKGESRQKINPRKYPKLRVVFKQLVSQIEKQYNNHHLRLNCPQCWNLHYVSSRYF